VSTSETAAIDGYQFNEKCEPEQPIRIEPETLSQLRRAFETSREAERQVQMAQWQAEAKIAQWNLALISAQRDLNVPSCWRVNFDSGVFEPIPAETATVQ